MFKKGFFDEYEIDWKNLSILVSIIALIGLIGFSGYKLYRIKNEYKISEDLYENIAEEFVVIETETSLDASSPTTTTQDSVDPSKAGAETTEATKSNVEPTSVPKPVSKSVSKSVLSVDFDKLKNKNQDVVAWLYSPGTVINYPVLQGSDNNQYLRTTLEGKRQTAGSIFIDYRNDKAFGDYNTIVYGHNMKNKSMFGSLSSYEKQSYYEKHPVMYLATPEKTYEIELIAGFKTTTESEIYTQPSNFEETKALYATAKNKSSFKASSEIQEGDRLITLSTCSNGEDNSRYVVVGKIK